MNDETLIRILDYLKDELNIVPHDKKYNMYLQEKLSKIYLRV